LNSGPAAACFSASTAHVQHRWCGFIWKCTTLHGQEKLRYSQPRLDGRAIVHQPGYCMAMHGQENGQLLLVWAGMEQLEMHDSIAVRKRSSKMLIWKQ
jgi:hypothetical protein